MSRHSLRRQLTLMLSGALAVVWLLAAVVVYQRAHHEADELLDSQLTQVADTLLAFVSSGEIEHVVEVLHEHAVHNPVPTAFEIWFTDDGIPRQLATSPGHASFEPGLADGFSERFHDGARWRFFTARSRDGHYRIAVGQAHASRERLAREIGLSLLVPATLALPFIALAVWWAVRRALRPVEALAREVDALDPRALAPLGGNALPDEIALLRDAFNALLPRVSAALDSERRFTADAAHELRTPLAALKVQAQVAQRATADGARRHALDHVIDGVDRMTHLVEQLLTLARVEPTHQAGESAFDPAPVLDTLCARRMAEAARRAQTLDVALAPDCRIAMVPAWFEIAARNLLDNALRYAGEGAHIEVRLTRLTEECRFSVADNGPGVPDSLRGRLTARFARGETDAEGCGLGLSIVARIAELSRARLEFDAGLARPDGGHGLAAILHFSAPVARTTAGQVRQEV